MPAQRSEFSCKIIEVFSGDDLIAFVDLEVENLWKKQRIRLYGVDTPNAIKESGDTKGGKVRSEVRRITYGRTGKITVVSKNANSWVVTLIIDTPSGPVNVNDYLTSQGFKYVAPEHNAKK